MKTCLHLFILSAIQFNSKGFNSFQAIIQLKQVFDEMTDIWDEDEDEKES